MRVLLDQTDEPGRRFVTLDAMRGIAAIVVAYRHFVDARGALPPPYGYLAVDLFFLLSGFVLAVRYDNRAGSQVPVAVFLRHRVIRLYPLFILGFLSASLVGAITGGWDSHKTICAVLGAAMFPCLDLPRNQEIFPLLVPAWSLFFEFFVANVLFAFAKGRTTNRVLMWTIAISAVLLLIGRFDQGNFDVGHKWDGFIWGFPRLTFSFFAGVGLYRLHSTKRLSWRMPAAVLLMALAVMLSIEPGRAVGRFYAPAVIFLFNPLLVFAGASSLEHHRRIGQLLGDASYAIYVIHIALIGIWGLIFGIGNHAAGLESVAFLGFALTTSLLLARFFDEPTRRWLRRHVETRFSKARAGHRDTEG